MRAVCTVLAQLPSAFVSVYETGEQSRQRLSNMWWSSESTACSRRSGSRKAWMFCGSGDHAQSAANILSLIASCVLHELDAETYLADVIRVLPYWPRDRYLELAPKYWARTRARLDDAELALPIGHVTVPTLAAEQQSSTD